MTKLLTDTERRPLFLAEICRHDWADEGDRAGASFAWISSDAHTDGRNAAKAAHAIATFVADHPEDSRACADRNPTLFRSLIASLTPYQGALVGDFTDVEGFDPLDDLSGTMPRTASLFRIVRSSGPEEEFIAEAHERAARYESAFAARLNADVGADQQPERSTDDVLWSARLLGLVAFAEATEGDKDNTSLFGPGTAFEHKVLSRLIQGSDPRISADYFRADGTLKAPDELPAGQSSLYAAQLANVLSSYPRLSVAVRQFNSTYSSIAKQ